MPILCKCNVFSHRSLDTLLPRLWPFLHHTSSSVRKSALLTLQKLTDLDSTVEPLTIEKLTLTLRHVYQRALTEHNTEVLVLIPDVWSDLLKSSTLNTLLLAACPYIGIWLFLAMQHPRLGIDPQYLVSCGEVKLQSGIQKGVRFSIWLKSSYNARNNIGNNLVMGQKLVCALVCPCGGPKGAKSLCKRDWRGKRRGAGRS
jgi:hypothetical protein